MANPLIVGKAIQGVGKGVGNFIQNMGAGAGARASQEQIQAAMDQSAEATGQQQQFQQDLYQPYMTAGANATGDLSSFRMRETGPYSASQFSGVDMSQDPGVQYRMNQAMGAMDASAANRGSLFSGAQAKALQDRSQDLASQEFNNAYKRQYGQFRDTEDANRQQFNLDADRNIRYDQARLGQLQGLSGQGLSASGSLGGTSSSLFSNDLANQVQLSGEMADMEAIQAMAPYKAWGSGISSMANVGGDALQSYFMNKGG